MTEGDNPMIEHQIIRTIKSGDAKMKPRWYFVVQAILVIIGLVVLFFIIAFAITFIIFAVQENGGLSGTGFGLTGWDIFFHSIPWSVLLLSLALILVLSLLLRRYSFIYQHPSLYLLFGLVILLGLISFFLSASNLHQRIEQDNFPIVGSFYQYEAAPTYYLYRGTIVQSTTQGFVLANNIGQTSTVIIPSGGQLNYTVFPAGTFVLIFGAPDPYASNSIEMYAIERSHPIGG